MVNMPRGGQPRKFCAPTISNRSDKPAGKPPISHQHEGGEGSERGRQQTRHSGDLDRQPEAVDDTRIPCQGFVPAQRKAREARILPRVIEREHDHEKQWQVKEQENDSQPELAHMFMQ